MLNRGLDNIINKSYVLRKYMCLLNEIDIKCLVLKTPEVTIIEYFELDSFDCVREQFDSMCNQSIEQFHFVVDDLFLLEALQIIEIHENHSVMVISKSSDCIGKLMYNVEKGNIPN